MKRVLKFLLIGILSTSCLEKMDYDLNENPTNRLVVEGGLTSDSYYHQIILSLTGKVQGDNPFRPASGAEVRISDRESSYYLLESETDPGHYYSDSLLIDIEKTYSLSIEYDGQNYEAEAHAVTSKPFDPIEYYPFAGGAVVGENPQGFYDIDLPGNFGGGEPYIYFLEYDVPDDWRDDFPYPIPPGFIDHANYEPIDTTYLIHPGLEPAALFEYGLSTIGGLPVGTQIREKRYYLTGDFYLFLRSILMETDWRGVNIMQTIPANVTGNISNGALGYFYVLDNYEVISYIEE